MSGTWGFAARLARRETRRRPGRTVLVMLLIAVPVAAMLVGSVLYRTTRDTDSERFMRRWGTTDYVVTLDAASAAAAEHTVLALMPPGSRVTTYRSVSIGALPSVGLPGRYAELQISPVNRDLARSGVMVRSGHAPQHAHEALISSNLAHDWHLRIGDHISLQSPEWNFTVTGIGVRADNWSDGLIVTPDALAAPAAPAGDSSQSSAYVVLTDVPGAPTLADARRLTGLFVQQPGSGLASRFGDFGVVALPSSTVRPLAWGWVAGALLLGVIGIIVAAAFATSARRQLVTLGQLAANGATERLMRRTMVLQGAWSGLAGSGFGLLVGALLLIIGKHRFAELLDHDPGPYVWAATHIAVIGVTGIVAAMIAAYAPARSGARVSVLSALAGRRPLAAVKRRVVPIGIATFAMGVLVLVLVTSASHNGAGDGLAAAAVLGGLLVLTGACFVGPAVVAAIEPLAARFGGALRVAARSVGRQRSRSAAVVTALAVAGAVAVASGTFVGSRDLGHTSPPFIARNVVLVQTLASSSDPSTSGRPPTASFLAVPARVDQTLRGLVSGVREVAARAAVFTPVPNQVGVTDLENDVQNAGFLQVGDAVALDAAGISTRDRATLTRVGALVAPYHSPMGNGQAPLPPLGRVEAVRVKTTRGTATFDVAYAHDARQVFGFATQQAFITAAKARALGLPIVRSGAFYVAPRALTESQRVHLEQLANDLMIMNMAHPGSIVTEGSVNVMFDSGRSTRWTPAYLQFLVAIGALVVMLVVVAIALSLAATESRDERDVLVALGSRPRTMRRVAAGKAAMMTVAGALLAIPVGFLPMAAILSAAGSHSYLDHGIVFPWTTAAMLILLIPVVAAVVGGMGSGVAQLVRPTQMSRLSGD